MKDKACVYDIVLKGEVIYVGMTNNPKKRLQGHRTSGVAPEGSDLFVHKWYPTRREAFKQERLRQIELEPVFCIDSPIPRKDPVDYWALFRKWVRRDNTAWADSEVDEYVFLLKKANTQEEIDEMHKKYRSYGGGRLAL